MFHYTSKIPSVLYASTLIQHLQVLPLYCSIFRVHYNTTAL